MNVAFEKGGMYWQIYQNAFQHHKKYYEATKNGNWKEAIDQLCNIPMHVFERELTTSIILEMERIYKGGTIAQMEGEENVIKT